MSESAARSTLVKKLRRLDAQPIESPMKSGVPDVNHRFGWIEMKALDGWPKVASDRPIRFKHPLMVGQKVWIRRRIRSGGSVSLCAKVGSEWFFWDCKTFDLDRFGTMSKADMHFTVDLHFRRILNVDEVVSWLSKI